MKISQAIEVKDSLHERFLSSKENYWEVVSSLDDYVASLFAQPPKGYTLSGNLLLGEDVVIDERATIVDRAVIGAGTRVADSVLLRGNVVIGDSCEIGHGSEVKHSIILKNSRVAHLNYVGDSVVGNDVNLAAGVVLANFKNGAKNLEVSAQIEGVKTPTGLQKLGALIGDGTKIGSNAVTDPGTIIGKNTFVYPLALIRGTIESNKIVKNKSNLEIVEKE